MQMFWTNHCKAKIDLFQYLPITIISWFKYIFVDVTTTWAKHYENIILQGDFDIDTKCNDIGTGKLEELCDILNSKKICKIRDMFYQRP